MATHHQQRSVSSLQSEWSNLISNSEVIQQNNRYEIGRLKERNQTSTDKIAFLEKKISLLVKKHAVQDTTSSSVSPPCKLAAPGILLSPLKNNNMFVGKSNRRLAMSLGLSANTSSVSSKLNDKKHSSSVSWFHRSFDDLNSDSSKKPPCTDRFHKSCNDLIHSAQEEKNELDNNDNISEEKLEDRFCKIGMEVRKAFRDLKTEMMIRDLAIHKLEKKKQDQYKKISSLRQSKISIKSSIGLKQEGENLRKKQKELMAKNNMLNDEKRSLERMIEGGKGLGKRMALASKYKAKVGVSASSLRSSLLDQLRDMKFDINKFQITTKIAENSQHLLQFFLEGKQQTIPFDPENMMNRVKNKTHEMNDKIDKLHDADCHRCLHIHNSVLARGTKVCEMRSQRKDFIALWSRKLQNRYRSTQENKSEDILKVRKMLSRIRRRDWVISSLNDKSKCLLENIKSMQSDLRLLVDKNKYELKQNLETIRKMKDALDFFSEEVNTKEMEIQSFEKTIQDCDEREKSVMNVMDQVCSYHCCPCESMLEA